MVKTNIKEYQTIQENRMLYISHYMHCFFLKQCMNGCPLSILLTAVRTVNYKSNYSQVYDPDDS